MTSVNKNHFRFTSVQLMVMGYLAVVLIGALLLTLPAATRAEGGTDFLTALFTATTSTCVTGLVVADTYMNWSLFGQWIILALIQVGGLGFMTMATLMSMFLRRHITLRERLVIMNCFNLTGISGVVRLTKNALAGTMIAEAAGAALLSFRFIPKFGFFDGLYTSIFTSVSAFCNAGIDVFGKIAPYSSLTTFRGDVLVNITVMLLIILGGLGFSVWEDVIAKRNFRSLTAYSKTVLAVTAALIGGGAAGFLIFEHANPGTLQGLSPGESVLASFFQSVTCRTAGFNTVDIAALTGPSKMLSCILMFIGGSSGSTAGGIKTVTFAMLIFLVLNSLRGRSEVVLNRRRVNSRTLIKAIAVTGSAVAALAFGIFLISLSDADLGFGNIIFECVSAMGTVGLSTGITPFTGVLSRIVLILLMFFGRVGILSIGVSILMKTEREKTVLYYPEGDFITG